ncbi:unnamed protein product [Callosobruchus maculatus]|nr:unnamed protein product [Callosobruchus maculatus]
MMHILKAALGTGIYAMPVAFYSAGMFLSVGLTILTGIICTHCATLLVRSGLAVTEKTEKTKLSYADISENACELGPPWAQKMSKGFRILTLAMLFMSYYLTLSCYAVISARSFYYVIEMHTDSAPTLRIGIACLIVPMILLCYIPHYKYLAPVSMVANIFVLAALLITYYYFFCGLPSISERDAFGTDLIKYPMFFSITIFGMMFIGVIMPLANTMKTPEHLVSTFGLFNIGMTVITFLNGFTGFMGYWRYGDEVEGSITLNLPGEKIECQVVNVFIGVAVFCSIGVQFFVCHEIAYEPIAEKYGRTVIVDYVIRTVIVVTAGGLAVAAPFIVPFVSILGAFCFSVLGIMLPIILYRLIYWEDGFGKLYWKAIKDILVLLFGIAALIFGTASSVEDVIRVFKEEFGSNSTTTAAP